MIQVVNFYSVILYFPEKGRCCSTPSPTNSIMFIGAAPLNLVSRQELPKEVNDKAVPSVMVIYQKAQAGRDIEEFGAIHGKPSVQTLCLGCVPTGLYC